MAEILEKLPNMEDFFGILDLKIGSVIIAAICVIHPFAYGCTFFMPLSYLIFTIWILVAGFCAASVLLFLGLIDNNALYIEIWIWYSLVFVVLMVLLLILLSIVLISRKYKATVLILLLGILWYGLTVYFILVVNSHRRTVKSFSETDSQGGTPGRDYEEETTARLTDASTPPDDEFPPPGPAEPAARRGGGCNKGVCFTSATKRTVAWFVKQQPQPETAVTNALALSDFKKEILFTKT